jgi:hypothetical protein
MRKGIPRGEANLFWLDQMLKCKLDITFGDVVLYADGAMKAIYKRLPNDDSAMNALKAYRARRSKDLTASSNAVITGTDTEDSEEETEEAIPSINHVHVRPIGQIGQIQEVDAYEALNAAKLYRNPAEIDLSAATKSYIMVLSIWVDAILSDKRGTYCVLIDKGAEANLVSKKVALALGLLITKGSYLDMNGVNARIDVVSIC